MSTRLSLALQQEYSVLGTASLTACTGAVCSWLWDDSHEGQHLRMWGQKNMDSPLAWEHIAPPRWKCSGVPGFCLCASVMQWTGSASAGCSHEKEKILYQEWKRDHERETQSLARFLPHHMTWVCLKWSGKAPAHLKGIERVVSEDIWPSVKQFWWWILGP